MIPTQSRSTLKDHRIPAFYACYLLKSIRTPKSRATYIGSTPNPPRRLRQHNGEITQGAWKTKQHRPWVMQMIVHGFPSRSAALQFEWAWQHPHRSRHLRDDNGKAVFSRTRKGNPLKSNIQIVRNMVSSHPYNMWSLHVKLFTEEALEAWKGANISSDGTPLPVGFTSSVELEGVDGKGGKAGSGRNGPIEVTDETFTLSQLGKAFKLSSAKQSLQCSICHEPIVDFKSDPLKYALCVSTHCTAISHLRCLSEDFLRNSSSQTDIIPRGGGCQSCGYYVLWGDIIRGCYRRQQGGVIATSEVDAEEDEESGSDEELATMEPQSSQRQKRGTKAKAAKKSRKAEDSEHEIFDLNAISSCDESEPQAPLRASTSKTRSRAPKSTAKATVGAPTKRTRKPVGTTKLRKRVSKKVLEGKSRFHTQATQPGGSSDEEFFDLNAISTDDGYDGAPPAPSPLKNCSANRLKGKYPEPITISHDRDSTTKSDLCKPESPKRHAASTSSRALALNPRSTMQPDEVDFFEIDHEFDVPDRRMRQSSVNNLACRGPSELEYTMSGLSISSPCASSDESLI